jgi:hypothetical protein
MVRRSLSRLAWYFGIRWGDPEFQEHPSARLRPLWLLVVGALLSGLLFGVISEAFDGFDHGVAPVLFKAIAWAVLMTLFHVVADRRTETARRDRDHR